MPSTISELAKSLKLSKGTVSMILSGKGDAFAEETRRRVLTAAKDAGYRPNPIARALTTGRTGILSLWLWSGGLLDSYHARVSHEMHQVLVQQPYQLLISPLDRHVLEFAHGKALPPWAVDGIVAHEASPAVEALLGANVRRRVPMVSTGSYNLVPGVDTVEIDLEHGAEEAVRHLLASGRDRVAYLVQQEAYTEGNRRFGAYARLMREAGRTPEVILAPDESRHTARAVIQAYGGEHGLPGAIFCHNDTLAIGAYRGLRDLGARVPDDVALVGCDGIEDAEYLEVPISTIVQPLDEMCALAFRYLEARMRDPEAPRQYTSLPTRLVIRESSHV
jgi:DNA-binding LacI/PurR family transcriptional regulator